ncbi:MAG: insulinase family protein, partial [bacterium]
MTPDPRKLAFGRLAVEPRFAERATLRNGIAVHLMEDRALPVVRFGAFVRTGGVYDPPRLAGRARLAASAIRQGGGALLPGDALDEELDFLGADINGAGYADSGLFWTWSLRRHLDRVLELFADVVRRPALPDAKIEQARMEMLEQVRRQWDQPAATADIMYRRQLFGADTPSGRLSTVQT